MAGANAELFGRPNSEGSAFANRFSLMNAIGPFLSNMTSSIILTPPFLISSHPGCVVAESIPSTTHLWYFFNIHDSRIVKGKNDIGDALYPKEAMVSLDSV